MKTPALIGLFTHAPARRDRAGLRGQLQLTPPTRVLPGASEAGRFGTLCRLSGPGRGSGSLARGGTEG